MNQKGMAISTILYMIIIIFGLVIITYMGILVKSNSVNRAAIDKVKTSLGVGNLSANDKLVRKQYRYMQADGTYSDWIDYININEIDKNINLTKISNNGSMEDNYDLTSNGIDLKIENGESYLDFNGSSDRGNGVSNQNGFVVNTLYVDGIINGSEDMFISFNATSAFFYHFNLTFGGPNTNYRTAMTDSVSAGQRFKAIVTWSNSGVYNIFLNGVKKTVVIGSGATYNSMPFEILKIALGYGEYYNTYYLDGKIYDLRLSSKRLTDTEAIALTSGTIDSNSILDRNTAEVIYGDFIQYRTIFNEPIEDNPLSNTVSARYIRDYLNGSTANTGNHWIEIEANTYLKEGDYFYGVIVGGTYTGTYNLNYYSGEPNAGEIYLTPGDFIHPNGLIYNVAANTNTTSTIENTQAEIDAGTSKANSALIMFTASDTSRFTTAYGKNFLLVKYINGQWYYDNNVDFTSTFVPNENDAIVGFVEKRASDTGFSSGLLFKYPFTYNVALGCTATSDGTLNSGMLLTDGNYTNGIDGTHGYASTTETVLKYVDIDLGGEYPIKDVTVWHYYPDGRAYYKTATEIYSSDRSSKYVLNNYLQNGIYKEMLSGMTFSVK